jgi:alkanesulfonate monooxygenase SsuD/methylene tetrahydromethanopterin reductase-like flavin-dependent oxidoreductase (luciferase family)
MPDAWINALSAAGTPEQAVMTIQHLVDAGTNEVIFGPVENDPHSFKETVKYLMPLLQVMYGNRTIGRPRNHCQSCKGDENGRNRF